MAVQWSGWMKYLYGGLWNPLIGIQSSGPSGWNEAAQAINDERAMQIGAVFRCIRIIAETCASLPMHGYKMLPGGDREALPDSHWLEALIAEPNSTMTGDEWRETQFGQMAGWGNAYSQTVRQSEGRVTELWPYQVSRMEVERKADLTLLYKYPNVYGVPTPLPESRVMHLRAFSLDGVMGLSPMGLARHALGLSVAAERYAASFFAQGGRPAGIMTSEKILTDKQREQIRKEYGDMADNSQKKFWLMEGALKYEAITVSPEDMQMLQTRTFEIADIARFFGVPLFLLMETEKQTSWGTGLEQMNLGFLAYTLRPYLQRMVTTFNRRIIPEAERGKVFVDIDETPLLALDSEALRELYGAYAQNGIMHRNEIRRKLKLPQSKDKNMDKFTVQTALTTVDRLGMIVPPAPPQPTGAP